MTAKDPEFASDGNEAFVLALLASEARWRSLIENTQDWVWEVDAQGCYTYASPRVQALLGYTPEEVLGKTPFDFMPPEECARVCDTFTSALTRRAPFLGLENINRHKDGSLVVLETNGVPFFDEQGALAGYRGIDRDITERKRIETELRRKSEELESAHAQAQAQLERRVRERTAELEAANRELEAFSYAVSHDLRVPLRAIKGYCSALQEECADALDDAGRQYLERIQGATACMSEFIDGLLVLSLVVRTELQQQPVDLSALAHDFVRQLREQEPWRNIDIRIEPGLTAVGDPALLRLLLQNLLGNAWKFTVHAPAACIHFARERRQGCDVFFVRDNGIGFAMEHAAKLFQPFVRLHGRDAFEGSGIGLATVRRIVERHGGVVSAEGTPQQGAAFCFTLAAK